ncbi:MAG: sigma-70 family RNA polymerase sigma factor [Candidatus Acetothermia bacterium]|jgi:RNA polymerase sigma-70 factor (ECF subfamily)|nr:sigma-70 family RNA polymerase sigma factor [Candidatus Acetothermia bacterium]MDH7504959.1 sigma-70 family RNA polymerase sigma factor [Candidatus Acetothermia bacterium]
MGDEPERGLIARIADGDREAWGRLFQCYAGQIYRYALTMVREQALAEEVVQETMLAIWRGAKVFRGEGRPSTWILGIARHKALDKLRQEQQSAQARAEEAEPKGEIEPEREAARQLLGEQVRAALEKLPAEQRETVVLAFYHGLSYQEIARLVGCPEGTVKSRMFYAKERLRALLEEGR